ncbi:hypothetical protein [Streptomyces sp. NBRC 110028]|uniref:hypothetical protein n=1 Tax=Streptomyces sp. NBRC 110028 TaxID=1621260 RepID=UPI00131E3E0F|nr:hypothetical protein [Streptomyces sp. NBRC 110028]
MPDVIPDDSCDEFPFAKSYEGGTPGLLCAEVIPGQISPGMWEVRDADPGRPVKFTEKCARGHVPRPENGAAGGKLGSFASLQRVLDLEKYNVDVPDIKFQ